VYTWEEYAGNQKINYFKLILVGSSETTREAPSLEILFFNYNLNKKRPMDEDIVRPGRKLPLHWSCITNYVGLNVNVTLNR